ncbi:lysylphosphatidylglycerol synthase transmembrane domain-containing protein [Pedobacter cryophilus]|uniref:Flippase-like domain-containing protein n=1 Tax=Pedobacter cryophilus TaxID=2571271 RepID=A0A4U1C5F5_9SPHI|nr:lysylphosphatidylglycerol synthase transmembrane domain-containing protein [Pedobacter cryophilus]TKC00609.1 flippase-like domain-containing protein [Pedobacter cryophilus]
MKINLIAIIKYVILFLIGLSIVYFLFKNQYHPDLFADLKSANWNWAFGSAFFVMAAHFFRALRWQLMIASITETKPKLAHTFNALMVGYLINLAVPRAGEIARCAILAKKEKLNMVSLLGTVIAERVIDLLMLLILVLTSLFIYADLLISLFQKLNFSSFLQSDKWLWLVLLLIVFLGLFLFLNYSKGKKGVFIRINRLFNKFKTGVLSVKKINNPFLFVVYTYAIWLFYILSSLIGFNVLQETSILGFSAAILTVIGGSLGMIAPIQGGLGAFHFMVTEVLAILNINKAAGLEYATIIHAAQTLAVIIFGFLGLILGFKINNTAHEK